MDSVNVKRIQLWRKTYGWGPTKIEGHLDAHYGIHIPHNRIYKLLVEKGLNKHIGQPRKTWGKKRWERQHSMTLWQGDWKDVRIGEPMLTFYDDHSRFVVASRRFAEATTKNSIRLLLFAVGRHGWPDQVLTDHGTQFANNRGEGLSEFERICLDNGVQVIHSTVRRPTTLGKLENFHGRYDSEIWVTDGDHGKFVRYWNHKRPNGAIGYKYPVEVFYNDRKKSPINSG
jgi:putative transposase